MVVYGDVEAPPASEETVCHPLPGHAYALSKLEAEQQLHQMAAHGDTELAVARIAKCTAPPARPFGGFRNSPPWSQATIGHILSIAKTRCGH